MTQNAVYRSGLLSRVAGAMLALAALAAPAAADWLVTRDGARIETRGPWEVKGRQVVFTLKNGTLSALRLSDVDLDASAAATAESRSSAAEAEEEAEVERKPVLVLTNKDVPRAAVEEAGGEPAGAEGEAGGEAGEAAPASPALSEGDVVVDSWKASLSRQSDGLELAGVVKNNGKAIVAKVTLKVTIPDGEGGTLYETNAFLRNAGLAPGGATNFRALLPGVFQLPEDPIFEVTAASVTLGGPPTEPAAEGEGEGQAGGG